MNINQEIENIRLILIHIIIPHVIVEFLQFHPPIFLNP